MIRYIVLFVSLFQGLVTKLADLNVRGRPRLQDGKNEAVCCR